MEHPPRAFPWEKLLPWAIVRVRKDVALWLDGAEAPRICLHKGCGRKYQPRRYNQRYCQDPQCQQEVRRWHAARRQARYREDVGVRARHAQAEKAALPASQVSAAGG